MEIAIVLNDALFYPENFIRYRQLNNFIVDKQGRMIKYASVLWWREKESYFLRHRDS